MNKKQSYKISDSLIKFLIEFSEGFFSPALLEKLFSAIETEAAGYHFTASSEANLIRIILAVFNGKLFLRELIQYPHHLEIVVAIAASSNYLTDITVRSPENLYQLFDQFYLNKPVTTQYLSKGIAEINIRFKLFNSKANMLRNLKSQCMLRIGVRDILGISSLEETVKQISITAGSVLSSLFENAYRFVLGENKIKNTSRKYCLASLGKLGGSELNYSSDVDLILFFDKNTKIGRKKNVEYFELLNETVQLFITTAGKLTANGFLYRIDFRLRPDGKNSPLCRTIADYERYYETRGEDWERQMLIKLNFLCGSKTLFASFQNYIVHYVYPVSYSTSPVEQIKKMKINIEKNITQNFNIKLFRGGIRDIEFGVQALQLLNGGENKSLQTGNTLEAIAQLNKNNLICGNEAQQLKTAYVFYRKIEHFLQLLNDTQTHNIPDDSDVKLMLAKYLAISSIKEFEKILASHRKNVRKIYGDIIGNNEKGENESTLNFEIFHTKQRAKSNFLYLSEGSNITGQSKFDARTTELFQAIILSLMNHLGKSNRPDKILDNFTKFIRSVDFPSIWYREFTDNKFLKKMLAVCNYSEFSIELLTSHKELQELILSRKIFAKNINSNFDNLSINALRLILSVQYTLGLLNQTKVSLLLFEYIQLKILGSSSKLKLQTNYFIAGLGSFGAMSLGFKSDIDLIFVVENLNNYEHVQNEFQTLLENIKLELFPFKVDCRLRPEGGKSPLVWDLKSYTEYLKNRARVWEFQSLLKAGFISGDKKLFNNFRKVVVSRISKFSVTEVRAEMLSMIKALRGKHNSIFLGTIDIKNGYGSLTYINFVVSFMLLCNPKLAKKLVGKSLLGKIQYFCRYDERKELFAVLKENFLFLKNVELSLHNCMNKRNSVLPKRDDELIIITDYLKIANNKQLIQKISKVSKSNYEIFNIVLNESCEIDFKKHK